MPEQVGNGFHFQPEYRGKPFITILTRRVIDIMKRFWWISIERERERESPCVLVHNWARGEKRPAVSLSFHFIYIAPATIHTTMEKMTNCGPSFYYFLFCRRPLSPAPPIHHESLNERQKGQQLHGLSRWPSIQPYHCFSFFLLFFLLFFSFICST